MTVQASPRPRCPGTEKPGFRLRLVERTERLLRPLDPRRATLRLVRCEAGLAVTKDFGDTPPLYRKTVGRYLIRRETRAYRRLQGVAGIPRLLPSPDPDMLVMEYIPGMEVSRLAPGDLPPAATDQLAETLRAMHDRGVAHLDLGHDSNGDIGRETNLIWSEWGRLYVVDLAGAFFRPDLVPLGPGFFREVARHDLLALDKLFNRFFPGEDRPGPTRLTPWVHRLMRSLKKV